MLRILLCCFALSWLASLAQAAAPPVTQRDTLIRAARKYLQDRQGEKAVLAYRQAIERLERQPGQEATLAGVLLDLADLYSSLARHADAEGAIQRALRIRQKFDGEDAPATAECLHELGKFYRIAGQPARAIPLLQQAQHIRETKLGKDHLLVADTLNQLAIAQMDTGHRLNFLPLMQRVLEIREKQLPANHPDIASTLNNLAVAHLESGIWGRQQKAFDLLKRGLKILEEHHRTDHADIAIQLINLAAVSEGIEARRSEAEGLYRRALKMVEKTQGPDHPNLAQCQSMLADLLVRQNKLADAEPLFRRALAIREARLPPTHPQLVSSLEDMVRVQAARERWNDVSDYLDRINRLMRLHVRYNLPALTTPEQLAFMQRTQEPAFHRSLTLPYLRPRDQALIGRAAEWVLNGKAVAHQTQAEQIAILREGASLKAEGDIRRLLAIRAELATLLVTGDRSGEGKHRERLAQLEEQQRQLTTRLGLGSVRLERGDPWVTLDAVRAAIPADGVLVEIVDHDLWDFRKNNWKATPFDDEERKKRTPQELAQSRFVALVIPPRGKGEVVHVDLGDRWEIGGLIHECQKAMKASLRKIQIDEEEAETEIRKPLEALSRKVLGPLEPHLGKARVWLISPDSDLWLVPWTALPLRSGRYAVEEHQISMLVTGRDLVRPVSKVKSGPALVLGDPDFDLASGEAREQVGRLVPKGTVLLRGPSKQHVERVPRDWNRLFGTADEVKEVIPRLRKYTKSEPRVFAGKEALESVVKTVRSPRVLVLSTHGYVLPEMVMPAALADGGDNVPARKKRMYVDTLAAIEAKGDALERCGIVLAGANRRAKDGPLTADDGILSGLEVLGCDLRGTELVVLSACETGLGQVNVGEGVAGLRQAFLLAGARSVVASLWKVSDRESARLMTLFWDNLASGQGKAEALREAQLAFMKERRAKEKAAHPFFWAAFSLTGEWK